MRDIALNPGASTGHFQRHLDTIFPPREILKNQYTIKVPGFDKYKNGRTTIEVPVLPPHEVLHEELGNARDVEMSFRQSVREGKMPTSYTQHRIVMRARDGETVWPLAVYLDGVPFQKRDGLLAIYVFCLPTGVRHLCAVIRKSEMCRCGCLGWCSIWELMSFLKWSLAASAKGCMPSERHDGKAWMADDAERAEQANQQIIKASVTQVKGDWSEFVHTLGLASWRSVVTPCFCCVSDRDHMGSVGDFVRGLSPCPTRTPSDYEQACRDCEVVV